jgi:hypothetical protein
MSALCANPSLADSLADAERDYQAGKFKEAKVLLVSECEHFPNQASPHYMLGNTLFALRDYQGAIKQYATAQELEPSSQAAVFSRQALERLIAHAQASPLASYKSTMVSPSDYGYTLSADGTMWQPPPNSDPTKGWIPMPYQPLPGDTLVKLRQSSSGVRVTDTRNHELSVECDAKVNAILREQHMKVFKLGFAVDSARNSRNNGNPSKPFNPASDIDPSMQDFYALKYQIENETEKRCAEVRAAYRNLEREQDIPLNIPLKLVPLGSNKFTQNYQINSAATGAEIPIAAPPAKSLQSVEKKK